MKKGDSVENSSSNQTILIAEDEEVNYHFLEMLLSTINPSYRILRAKDGQEAVNIYKKENGVLLVLMDIKMPNMDGYEATRIIKGMDPKARIIAQTALTTFDAREKALEAGCDDFLLKPIRKSLLEHSIKHLLSEAS